MSRGMEIIKQQEQTEGAWEFLVSIGLVRAVGSLPLYQSLRNDGWIGSPTPLPGNDATK